MKYFEIKNTGTDWNSVQDVDDTSRRVKVVISRMGNKDLDGDVIDKGAYNKTLKERGPKGAGLIWHLTDHSPSLKSAVARFKELYVEGDNLVGVTDIPATTWGNDVMELYKTGNINQHSVGFRTIKSDPEKAGTPDEYRLIKEILLYEGSAVLWGANPDTPTMSVGKSLTKQEATEQYLAELKELNNLAKTLRNGRLTDETCELIEIQIVQKTERLKQYFDLYTQPGGEPVEPKQDEELLDVLKTFNNSLILSTYDTRRTEVATG